MSQYLSEAFEQLNTINEEAFDLSKTGLEDLKDFQDKDDDFEIDDDIEIIDTDAYSEDELQDTYNGKVILDCNVCHSKIYKDPEDIVVDDDCVNPDDECPTCQSKEGYTIVGQIEKFEEEELSDSQKDYDEEDLDNIDDEEPIDIDEDEDEDEDDINDSKKDKKKNESFKRHKKKLTEGCEGPAKENSLHPNEAKGITKDGEKIYLYFAHSYRNMPKVGEYVVSLDDVPKGTDNPYENGYSKFDYAILYSKRNPKKDEPRTVVKKIVKIKEELDDNEKVSCYELQCDNGIAEYYYPLLNGDDSSYELNNFIGVRPSNNFIKYKNLKKLMDSGKVKIMSGFSNNHINESFKKNRRVNEGLSYGEISAIESEWNKFKKKVGSSDAETAWEFIEKECSEVYPDKDEQDEIFTLISGIEEPTNESFKKNRRKTLTEAPYLEPEYDSRNSFYNKAFVTDDENTLYSYGTKVMEIRDGKPIITIDVNDPTLLSMTTLRHIKEFLKQHGFKADTKQQIIRDYFINESFKKSKKYKKLNEGNIKANIKTDAEEFTFESDGETFSITNKKDDFTQDDEVIAPIDDETEEEIMSNEDNEDSEFTDDSEFEDVEDEMEDVDEIDEESMDELGESYLKKVYSNVNNFRTTSAKYDKNTKKLQIEGLIKFNSGATKKTKFILEAFRRNKENLVLRGCNEQITRGKKAFSIKGKVNKNKFLPESLQYRYSTKDEKGKRLNLFGTVHKNH